MLMQCFSSVLQITFSMPIYTFNENEGSVRVAVMFQEDSATLQAGLEATVTVTGNSGTAKGIWKVFYFVRTCMCVCHTLL